MTTNAFYPQSTPLFPVHDMSGVTGEARRSVSI